MNEQLVVKNFGPIKDATVDFKRVTVFIGPTGGGKSTLAKLAAVFRDEEYNLYINPTQDKNRFLSDFSLTNFYQATSDVFTKEGNDLIKFLDFKTGGVSGAESLTHHELNINLIEDSIKGIEQMDILIKQFKSSTSLVKKEMFYASISELMNSVQTKQNSLKARTRELMYNSQPHFLPANRNLLPAVEYSWAGLLRDDIGLPKDTLDFANSFALARKDVSELDILFLNVKYFHSNGQDFIKIPESETLFRLYETASGIQSVTPLLVLLEHLSRNTEQAQSFIIEEPELNLYPTAQQGLLNWLVEKCTKGANDLTITTHSPYILSHLNLLLYAYQVGNKDEEKRAKVKAIIPEEYWINPDEFAAYYVNGPEGENGVRSLVDAETKLISQNGLDTVSGIQADQFDQLLDINSGF